MASQRMSYSPWATDPALDAVGLAYENLLVGPGEPVSDRHQMPKVQALIFYKVLELKRLRAGGSEVRDRF
jgi:hypothetical protein